MSMLQARSTGTSQARQSWPLRECCEHQDITFGEVNGPFAQVHLDEILAPLSFKLFRERRVDDAAIRVEEFHPCRMFFPNLDKGDDGISAGLFEQCNGTVNILGTAQRCRGLQGEDSVIVLTVGFELSHHVLQHRNGGRIVAGQFGGRRKGTSRPQARPTSAISSSSVESTARQALRGERRLRGVGQQLPSKGTMFLRGMPLEPPRAVTIPSTRITVLP